MQRDFGGGPAGLWRALVSAAEGVGRQLASKTRSEKIRLTATMCHVATSKPDDFSLTPGGTSNAWASCMSVDISGKVVVITGGSAGVGRAIAREMASRGARIALIARGEDRLAATRDELQSHGAEVIAISADVADATRVESAAERVERDLGPIDVWINNAMVTVLSPVAEMSAEEYDRVTRVTYLGAVHGTLSALARMRPRNAGHIIQIGSALAYRAIPLQSAYCAAKHAMRGFTDSLRSELIHDGSAINLTMVQLPAVNTPQFGWCRTRLDHQPQPVPPIYQPEVIARSVADIALTSRREVWLGGSTIKTVWGSRLASAFLDHYLAKKAYSGQQTEERIDPSRPDNLHSPLPGDPGAHGQFDERARSESAAAWLAVHRAVWASAAAVMVVAMLVVGGAFWLW